MKTLQQLKEAFFEAFADCSFRDQNEIWQWFEPHLSTLNEVEGTNLKEIKVKIDQTMEFIYRNMSLENPAEILQAAEKDLFSFIKHTLTASEPPKSATPEGKGEWISYENYMPPLAPPDECYNEQPWSIIVDVLLSNGREAEGVYDFTYRTWCEPEFEAAFDSEADVQVTHWRLKPPANKKGE